MDQRAKEVLDRFHFIEPPPRGRFHCNQSDNVLQLQIDIFCNDMLSGLLQWVNDVQEISEVNERINNILKIYPYNQDIKGIIHFG
jgi:hypothetical protein